MNQEYDNYINNMKFGMGGEEALPPGVEFMTPEQVAALHNQPEPGIQNQAGDFSMMGFGQNQYNQMTPQPQINNVNNHFVEQPAAPQIYDQAQPQGHLYDTNEQPDYIHTHIQQQPNTHMVQHTMNQAVNNSQNIQHLVETGQLVWDSATGTFVEPAVLAQRANEAQPPQVSQQITTNQNQTICPGSNLQNNVDNMNTMPEERNPETGVMNYDINETASQAPPVQDVVPYIIPELASATVKRFGEDEVMIREVVRSDVLLGRQDEAFVRHMVNFYKNITVDDACWDGDFAMQITYSPFMRLVVLNGKYIGFYLLDEVIPELKATLHGLCRVHDENGKYAPSIWKAFKKYRILDIIIKEIKSAINIHSLNIKLPEYLEFRKDRIKDSRLSKEELDQLNGTPLCRLILDHGFKKRGNLTNDDRKNGRRISNSFYQLVLHYWQPKPVELSEKKVICDEEKTKNDIKHELQSDTKD